VNLACQTLIFTMFPTCKTYLSQQNTVLARTKISGTREKKGNKSGINYPGELTRRIPHGDTKYLLGTVVKLIQI
jgi:hypothetical protein